MHIYRGATCLDMCRRGIGEVYGQRIHSIYLHRATTFSSEYMRVDSRSSDLRLTLLALQFHSHGE